MVVAAPPRRVIFLTTSFPASTADPSGSFVEADALARVDAGDEVHVVAPGRPASTERRGPLTIHWTGADSLFGWPGFVSRLRAAPWRAPAALAFAGRARRLLARLRPQAVVAHWLVPSAWPLARGLPLERAVAHGGDVRAVLASPAWIRAGFVERLLSSRARVQFVAESLAEALARGLPPALAERLAGASFVAPCPLRPLVRNVRASIDARARLAGDAPLVTVCARLMPSKRVELAIDAAARLDAQLVVIGSGPAEAALRRRARPLGDRVRFAGRLPHDETLAIIAASDALLSCSGVEAAPTVVREARALGVPVVATAAGDVARWAQRDAGISLAAPEPAALAAALVPHLKRGARAAAPLQPRSRDR